jgi:ribonuclease M5
MMDYLRRAASARGVIILTDSDGAGFKIRGYLKGALQGVRISHAYIPATKGKERRKETPSAEGLLGVEGISCEVIREALQKAGATEGKPLGDLTKFDLYEAGLLGKENSADRRRALAVRLSLPPRLSSTAFLDVLNLAMTRAEFLTLVDIGFDEGQSTMV